MNVLYLTPQPSSNSSAFTAYSFLEEQLTALADVGVGMHVVTANEREAAEHDRVTVHRIPKGDHVEERTRTLRLLLNHGWHFGVRAFISDFKGLYHWVRIEGFIAEVARRESIDIIHSHFGWPGGLGGALASRETATPLVSTFHGMDLLVDEDLGYGARRNLLYRLNLPFLLEQADRTLYVSEFMRQVGLDLGAPESRSRVLHWGVELSRFTPVSERRELRRSLGYEVPLLLSVGGLIERKGVKYTLQALSQLESNTDFVFLICGRGPRREELEELAESLGLTRHVEFLGYVPRDEIPEYFAAADVFVHSAILEAAGVVLLEAMASGRPVVCSDAGGPAEYVEDGTTGYVVPPRDPDALTDKIEQLLESPGLADRMGQRGRERVEEGHSYEGMLQQIIQIYEGAIQSRTEGTAR